VNFNVTCIRDVGHVHTRRVEAARLRLDIQFLSARCEHLLWAWLVDAQVDGGDIHMQQRKDEIAAKRARLAELKKQRELRQQDFGASRQSVGTQDEVTLLISPDFVSTDCLRIDCHEVSHP